MTTLATLQSLVGKGGSETLEFKRSTAELRRAGETLCAFVNGKGAKCSSASGPMARSSASKSLKHVPRLRSDAQPFRAGRTRRDAPCGRGDRQVIVLYAPPARQRSRSSTTASRCAASVTSRRVCARNCSRESTSPFGTTRSSRRLSTAPARSKHGAEGRTASLRLAARTASPTRRSSRNQVLSP